MLSNFSSFMVHFDQRLWPTSEHAYQAMKFSDVDTQEAVRRLWSAHTAMNYARTMPHLYRKDWEEVKVQMMEDICRAKWEQHVYVQQKLEESGDTELVESSPIDSFWGWGPNKDGLNHLGRIWMRIREDARKVKL